MAKGWILTKVDNQADFIQRLKKPRPEKSAVLDGALSSLKTFPETIRGLTGTTDEKRGSIMIYEGAAGKAYSEALSLIMPERFAFSGRSRNPAKDEFNQMIPRSKLRGII